MSTVSDTRIRSGTQFWADKVQDLTDKINAKKANINDIKNTLDDIQDQLDNSDYQDLSKQRANIISNEKGLQAKLATTKSSTEQAELNQQINQLQAQRYQVSNKLKGVANTNGYGDKLTLSMQKERIMDTLNSVIADLNNQREMALSQQDYWRNQADSKRRARVAKYNAPIIADRLNQPQTDTHTKLYRTDMQDPTVFDLIETSPTETDTNDIATKPIDGDVAQSNFIARSSAEYTATFYLKGNDFNDVNSQYQKLADWSYQYEFTVNGFTNWQHAFISSIEKSTDATINHNGLIVSITFDFAKQAQIKYKSEPRPAVRHKAGGKKRCGRKRRRKTRYVRVKSGMTYWSIARRFGVSLSHVMKMNRWPASRLPVGVKVRYK